MAPGQNEIHVLHVDDDPDLTALTATVLEGNEERFRVDTASSATEGLEFLADHEVDGIVSDYDMPGRTGIEFLEAIRKDDADIPFILFTGKGSEEVASEALRKGATDYLQKGAGTDQYDLLANRVENAVEQSRDSRRADNLERIRRVVRDINQALVRADSREEVDRRVCEIVAGADPYLFAWVGEYDVDSTAVEPRQAAGDGSGYLDAIDITVDDSPTGQGPTAQAVRSRELVVMQNISENPEFEPWKDRALERGFESSAAIPLVFDGARYGILNVYADRAWAFDELERELLEELGGDIAHALYRVDLLAEVRQREIHLKQAQMIGNIGSWHRDFESGTLHWSEGVYELFGVEESKTPTFERFIDNVHPDDREHVESAWENAQAGEPYDVEHRIVIDGETKWVRERAEFEFGYDGDPRHAIGVVQDISAQKEREQELIQERTRLRALFEESPNAITIHDGDGNILDVNKQGIENLGYARDELLSMNVAEIDAVYSAQELLEFWDGIETDERVQKESEHRRADGSTFPIEVWVTRMEIEGDDQFIAISRDVTERRKREQELEDERAFARQTMDAIDDLFYVIDMDGELVRVNERASEISGYPTEEIRSMDPIDFFVPEDREKVLEHILAALDGETSTLEARLVTSEGETVPYEFRKRQWRDSDGTVQGVVGIGRDISERKARERKLERRNERLDEFAGIVSHDLRNPLNVAQSRLELLEDDCDSQHAEPITHALERMERIIDDTLMLAREGRSVGEKEEIELEPFVRDCWDNVDTASATVEVDEQATISADPERVAHVFENLFRNAIEHGGSAVTVRVGVLSDGFYVENTGPPIPEEDREAVFGSSYSTSAEGAGLGLPIVKEIAEAHGWTVEISDGSGGGPRFVFSDVL